MKKLIILFAVLAVVPLAFADNFTLQNYTITANSTDPGLGLAHWELRARQATL
jgi:hypothetical protein